MPSRRHGERAAAHLPHQSTWMPAHSLHALAGLLLLFGVVALYATRAAAAGRLGLGGFLAAFVGTALCTWSPVCSGGS